MLHTVELPVLEGTETFNKNTVIVYEGLSLINKEPVVVLMTGLERASENTKTGKMVQLYILCSDVSPLDALRTGADAAICGGCPLRPNPKYLRQGKVKRACYVRVDQAPFRLWKTYIAGRYRRVTLEAATELCAEQVVRLGAYGDPAAIPIEVWDAVLQESRGHTAYTHQWKARKFQEYRKYCQASVDNDRDAAKAREMGWGTFRVRSTGDVSHWEDEHLCPASKEAGKLTTCEFCLRCGGGRAGARFGGIQHITIPAHGAGKNNLPD